MSKAKLYAYIGHASDEPHDPAGNKLRSEWVELPIELEMGESVKKLSWRSEEWGSNSVVMTDGVLGRLVGKTMNICDAVITDKEQKEAFKNLLRDTIYGWHDDIFNRYQLEGSTVKELSK